MGTAVANKGGNVNILGTQSQTSLTWFCLKITAKAWLCLLSFSVVASENPSQPPSECINAIRTANLELAKKLCLEQLQLAKKNQDQTQVLASYLALMDTHKLLKDDQQFSKYAELAKNHPLFESSPRLKYKWLRMQAIVLHHQKQYLASRKLFQDALKIALELNDHLMISNSNVDLGISTTKTGDFKTALNHYRTSLDLTRELKDQYAIGLALKNVAEVYMQLEQYPDAIRYYEEGLEAYQTYTQTENYDQRVHQRITTVYERLMDAHQFLNQTAAAKHYKDMLSQSQAYVYNDHDWANHLITEGKQLMDLEQHQAAADKFQQALHLYQHSGDENPTEIYLLMAKTYQQLNQSQLALNLALNAENSIKHDSADSPLAGEIYRLLTQMYHQSDPDLALAYAFKLIAAREQFLNTKYNTDLKTIQHQIEIEKNHNKLVNTQLENAKQKVKIQELNNQYLWLLLMLLTLMVAVIYLIVKKRSQQRALRAAINHHKNQLAVLSLTNKPPNKAESAEQLKQEDVNEQLVQTMHDATNLWLKTTGESLIELADRSKIWTITNDNGTLRARSLDKYLSVQKMPTNPRWRNVVRTCHFVLAEPELDRQERQHLNQKLEDLIQTIKTFYGTAVK